MNFYDLNQIIEQSKLSEIADIRRAGFTPAGTKPTPTPGTKPTPTTGTKPTPTPGTKPTTPGAKTAAGIGQHSQVPGAKRPARIKFGKIPPTCPSFGCKEPEASPQKIVKDLKDLKPDQKKEVDKLVQSFTK